MPFVDHTPPLARKCNSTEHEPPSMIVLPAGRHVWQCPACGAQRTFNVERGTL